jgi:serine/threonine protein kinase HipA of HipAB toxin-antitoxin module
MAFDTAGEYFNDGQSPSNPEASEALRSAFGNTNFAAMAHGAGLETPKHLKEFEIPLTGADIKQSVQVKASVSQPAKPYVHNKPDAKGSVPAF